MPPLSAISLVILHKFSTMAHAFLLYEQSHKQDLKFTQLELGANHFLHVQHCTECPLHSPICNNQACCRKLNIATWSYDIRQAVRAENYKQRGTLDICLHLAETLMTNFLPLYFISDSSYPNGNLYPFNPAHFLSQRCNSRLHNFYKGQHRDLKRGRN